MLWIVLAVMFLVGAGLMWELGRDWQVVSPDNGDSVAHEMARTQAYRNFRNHDGAPGRPF